MKQDTKNSEPIDEFREMTFIEHLEELRWMLIKSLLGIVVCSIISWFFIDTIINDILLYPAKKFGVKLQNLKPFGQLFLYFQVTLFSGLIISLPWVVYQIWKFIEPALHKHEKKYVSSIVIFTSLFFLLGAAFAYFIMLPFSLNFAFTFGSPEIENKFAIDEYLSVVLSLIILAGVVFELPMLSFFLTKLGLLTPKFMRKHWRFAIVFILVLAAIITPTVDPVNQSLLAIPLFLLYELSILVSKFAMRKRSEG
ncbi:MAG: twin-arginine translocase subunit TatC [Ignavibacteria bacterium]|nr:twin-arginine translocase subunit TatC [Ignavibacteria bacterium]